MKEIGASFKIIAAFALLISSCIVALINMDYNNMSLVNNLWQYILLLFSIVGSLFLLLHKDFSKGKKYKMSVVFLVLSTILLFVTVAYCIAFSSFDVLKLLVAILLVSSSVINYFDNRKRCKNNE